MNYPTSNIVPFYTSEQAKAAEKEKMLNALKFRMAVSTLARLLKNHEITPSEFEQGRAHLARRWGQDTV